MKIPLYYFVNIIILSKTAFEMLKGVKTKRLRTSYMNYAAVKVYSTLNR